MRIQKLNAKVVEQIVVTRRASDDQAQRVAARICADVEQRGDAAVLAWARKLDGALATRVAELRVPTRRIAAAAHQSPQELLRALQSASRNIRRVARQQLPRPWSLRVASGVQVSQVVRPLDTVACYVPGGRFSLVSTLLMTAIPAQVAGVRRILVACPKPNAAVLAAAHVLGLDEVYELGGAQAIAAFAFGTQSIPRADMICGPGNRYVAAAKQLVSTRCKIDMRAGPTEVLVLAERGNARYIAADLLAQAEHDADASALLVTPSPSLARAVQSEVAAQLAALPQASPAGRAVRTRGRILLASDWNSAVAFANALAPEHLSLPSARAGALRSIQSAGSVFLGPWSAQPLGDYATGTNHVLPTSGRAAARGGLSAADFVKCIAVQRVTRRGFVRLAPVASALARAEALVAHERAVAIRNKGRKLKGTR